MLLLVGAGDNSWIWGLLVNALRMVRALLLEERLVTIILQLVHARVSIDWTALLMNGVSWQVGTMIEMWGTGVF